MSTFVIQNITRWTEYNEYEGQMEGTFDQHPVTVYVQVYNEPDWDKYTPGDTIAARLWLERGGDVEQTDDPLTPELRQQEGIHYQAAGRVLAIKGEQVWLDSGFPLRVDMDWPARGREQFPKFTVGDWLKVNGVLRLELDDEEE
ncbi:MAG: hypothetical protein KJ063_14335 [Anaerolineae bacterium]|nr:hypothetical protein [Anaerolineae bacterium]